MDCEKDFKPGFCEFIIPTDSIALHIKSKSKGKYVFFLYFIACFKTSDNPIMYLLF